MSCQRINYNKLKIVYHVTDINLGNSLSFEIGSKSRWIRMRTPAFLQIFRTLFQALIQIGALIWINRVLTQSCKIVFWPVHEFVCLRLPMKFAAQSVIRLKNLNKVRHNWYQVTIWVNPLLRRFKRRKSRRACIHKFITRWVCLLESERICTVNWFKLNPAIWMKGYL